MKFKFGDIVKHCEDGVGEVVGWDKNANYYKVELTAGRGTYWYHESSLTLILNGKENRFSEIDPIFETDDNFEIVCSATPSYPVNQPNHYTQGGMEVIEVIKAKLTPEQFYGYCFGNVIKYVLRHPYKGNPEKDLNKAKWYIDRMLEK